MTKPPLSVVAPGSNLPQPPRALGPHGLDLWSAVMREYTITDPGGIELLQEACTALDRAEALSDAISKDGVVVRTRSGMPKPHPALPAELSSRAFVCKQLERLGLNLEAVRPIGRPPGRRDVD